METESPKKNNKKDRFPLCNMAIDRSIKDSSAFGIITPFSTIHNLSVPVVRVYSFRVSNEILSVCMAASVTIVERA